MRIELKATLAIASVVIILVGRFIPLGAHQASEQCERLLPPNIALNHDLEHALSRVHRASATFRGQCDRIGAASALSVTLQIDLRIPRSCEAFTRFSRRGRELYADVHIPPAGTTMPRLVGHEFEHIIEQLDGLNLRALAQVKGAGVYQSSPDIYETNRAQHAGLLIATKTHSARRAD